MLSNQKNYKNAKKVTNEFINTFVDEYIQSEPVNPTLLDCWDYVKDSSFLHKNYLFKQLSDEEKEIIEAITFERFVSPILSFNTFKIYLTNQQLYERVSEIVDGL